MRVSNVKFSRPGDNGVKECTVDDGTSIEDAMEQSGLEFNPDKEAVFVCEEDGEMDDDPVELSDDAENGTHYVIVPQSESN
jgi:hypothetical protein